MCADMTMHMNINKSLPGLGSKTVLPANTFQSKVRPSHLAWGVRGLKMPHQSNSVSMRGWCWQVNIIREQLHGGDVSQVVYTPMSTKGGYNL